jgi:hypothetical protein
MSQTVEGDDYPSAVLCLKLHAGDLWNLCELRLGLQTEARENPGELMALLNNISKALGDIGNRSPDGAVAGAARERQICFDEASDPLFQHILHHYQDPQQLWEAGAKYRSRLRRELNILTEWAKALLRIPRRLITQLESLAVVPSTGRKVYLARRPTR